MVLDAFGRRRVFLNGVSGKGCFAVIDPEVWNRLHGRNPDMTDVELLELHHDDFAHGALAFIRAWPNRRPFMVGLLEMRMISA